MPAFFELIRLVVSLLCIAVALLPYVLSSYALYRMGRACGIAKPQKAFVPVLNVYQLGQIADAHRARNERKKPLYAQLLLWLQISLLSLGVLLFLVMLFLSTAVLFSALLDPMQDSVAVPTPIEAEILTVLLSAVIAAFAVCFCIALYKVFRLYNTKGAILHLILSVVLPFALPVILMLVARRSPTFFNAGEPNDTDAESAFSSEYTL